MLNAEVDALLHVAVADDLVDDDSDSAGSHVVHDSGASARASGLARVLGGEGEIGRAHV